MTRSPSGCASGVFGLLGEPSVLGVVLAIGSFRARRRRGQQVAPTL